MSASRQPTPEYGASTFVSADDVFDLAPSTSVDAGTFDGAASGAPSTSPGDRDDAVVTVDRGNLYRLGADQLLLNFNAYRGLQLIDLSNPDLPVMKGSIRATGTPVEMYAVGRYVFMLLNDWSGYYARRPHVDAVEDVLGAFHYEGGVVLVADISDPDAPILLDRALIPGAISTSRLKQSGDQVALYVVTSRQDTNAAEMRTLVKSFSLDASGRLTPRSEIDLGGNVTDIQATSERLLVARSALPPSSSGPKSQVTILDIQGVDGSMLEGASVVTEGVVRSKDNMDLFGDILRIVTANTRGSLSNTNHIETFDARDISNVTRIAHETFGDGEDLYATIFDGPKAFFVTYRFVDPFHAFEIGADGSIVERSQFIVSGWNNFFRLTQNGERLVGIGWDDPNQHGRQLAISLYDATDLTNPSPLLARETATFTFASASEATWDDQAFTVIEGATHIAAPNGEIETNVVLLPFSGQDPAAGRYVAAVQIFTFSATTLTRRGVMDHGAPVRRTFAVEPDNRNVANLSDVRLGLYDVSNPDAPIERGRMELAPYDEAFFVVGDDYGVRLRRTSYAYSWWGYAAPVRPHDVLEVIPLEDDVDRAMPVASIDIEPGAPVYQMGDRLAVLYGTVTSSVPAVRSLTLDMWSLADPTAPALLGRSPIAGCEAFGCDPAFQSQVMVAGETLVFVEQVWEQISIGTRHVRYIEPDAFRCGSDCFISGFMQCSSLHRIDGTIEPETCSGSPFKKCPLAMSQEYCTDIEDPTSIATHEVERTYEVFRDSSRAVFHPLDISDPSNPVMRDALGMSQGEESTHIFAAGTTVYSAWKVPHPVPGDTRNFADHYFRAIDFSAPSTPEAGPAINVPGVLLAVTGDTLVTRDALFNGTRVETSVDKLVLRDDVAYLVGVKRFDDRRVRDVVVEGQRHVLVTHQSATDDTSSPAVSLSVLDLADSVFDETASLPIAPSAVVLDVDLESQAHRALFLVSGGILALNLNDLTAPEAEAFFPMRGQPSSLVANQSALYLAAQRYGLYRFDFGRANLLEP
ncbi:MAG: beta-propeller domain-containing protein [Deltaproteobacteria bacterium]|nr:beta-propeller domain-containing protein [Deltaproteobacteria bacterium]